MERCPRAVAAHTVRASRSADHSEIDASRSHLAKFVGIEVYEAAGGRVRRDLFSDAANAGFIADPDLLHRLATERLVAAITGDCRTRAGSWVETRTRRDYNRDGRLRPRLHSVSRESRRPTEQAELDALIVKRDAASDALNAYYDDRTASRTRTNRSAWRTRSTMLGCCRPYAERFETFDADDMKRAGAFVAIDRTGNVGRARPECREDAKKLEGGHIAQLAHVAVGVAAYRRKPTVARRKALPTAYRASHGCDSGGTWQQPNVALAVLM